MEIKWTSRFESAYNKESMPMQALVQQALHEFELRYSEDKNGFIKTYDRVKGISKTHRVLEIKVSGGRRMIADWDSPKLTLLDVGDHETVRNAVRQHLHLSVKTRRQRLDLEGC